MITVIKKEIKISKELLSKIEWACAFSKQAPQIINGNLRIIKHINLAYVEPHRVLIKEKLFLFFNEHDYFYIGNLENKYPMTKLREMVDWYSKCI